jgi:predicted secreted hydrolase
VLLLAVVISGAGLLLLVRPSLDTSATTNVSVSQALAGDDSGFALVTEPREFAFPADHGPHPDYGIEWWYYTGNLATDSGRRFGYELTFFRVGLSADDTQRESTWAASQLYVAHFALTDVEGGAFHSAERFGRGAAGLAGAQSPPYRVWLEDWYAESDGEGGLPMRLRADDGDFSIELSLDSEKPVVLQGDNGLSQKSAEAGNASYYYSLTRMHTEGVVRIGDNVFEVSGSSWMDREWSTTALAEYQEGWDWFALQLSDGRDLMYYQLRLRDGGVDSHSSGIIVGVDGQTVKLTRQDVRIEVMDTWNNDRGTDYPSRWRLSVPSQELSIEIIPYLDDQELDVSVRYWEGAVRFEGIAAGTAVNGVGYIEMTGYAEDSGGRS